MSMMLWVLQCVVSIVLVLLDLSNAFWLPSQPKTNIWITLANMTGQDSICLATASPSNPFSTCLVGVPLDTWPIPENKRQLAGGPNVTNNWDGWVVDLPQGGVEPQEIELLGSVKMDFCLYFNYSGKNTSLVQVINASSAVYRNQSFWCNYTSPNVSKATNTPLKLPPGIFLICGDRAWQGILSHIKGGPCSLGRLTLLSPNISTILMHKRGKRSIHAFGKDCKDNIEFWGTGKTVLASIFAPGVAVANASNTLNKLGCWLAKQTNATSLVLSGLLADVGSIRHATLQNHAAIDFLLLAQGHGCEDFDGMCCMNLSDHSESIHKAIRRLDDMTKKLTYEDWGLDECLNDWSITGWIKDLIKNGPVLLTVVLVILMLVPCILQYVQLTVEKSMKGLWLVEKQKGGIVEYLTDSHLELLE